MSVEEIDIKQLTPWSASTMALLCIRGVKFMLRNDARMTVWHANWHPPGEGEPRHLVERELWRLVHKVALAYGRDGKGEY